MVRLEGAVRVVKGVGLDEAAGLVEAGMEVVCPSPRCLGRMHHTTDRARSLGRPIEGGGPEMGLSGTAPFFRLCFALFEPGSQKRAFQLPSQVKIVLFRGNDEKGAYCDPQSPHG